MGLNPNDPRPQHQQIADELRVRIARGDLAPGDRLPTIKELMEEYGVYNQAVQGALKLLQADGLTQGVPGRGTFVRVDVDLDALHDANPATRPSAEYNALRSQLEALAGEVAEIRQQLEQLAAQQQADSQPAR